MMRQQVKTILIKITAGLIILLIALYVFGALSIDDGSDRWAFAGIAIFGAPIAIIVLMLLWLAYAFYPSLAQSLTGMQNRPSKHSHISGPSASATALRYLSLVCLFVTTVGLVFLMRYIVNNGPFVGIQSAVLPSSANQYFDLQIGLLCIVFGVVLALINYGALRILRRIN
jgi:hypothetical protein